MVELIAVEDQKIPGIGQPGVRMGVEGLLGIRFGSRLWLVEGSGLQGGPQVNGSGVGVFDRFIGNEEGPGCLSGIGLLGRDGEFPREPLDDCFRREVLLCELDGRYGKRWIWRKWSVPAAGRHQDQGAHGQSPEERSHAVHFRLSLTAGNCSKGGEMKDEG